MPADSADAVATSHSLQTDDKKRDNAIPVGRNALSVIGINGDNSEYGNGVKVAVIDSGVQEHETFTGKEIKEFDFVVGQNGEGLPIDQGLY